MRDQRGGSIINIGTMAAYSGGAAICAYGSSKAALLNLTKSMAQEWAPCTGSESTCFAWSVHDRDDGRGRAYGARLQRPVTDGTLMKRIADPDEIVGPVLYLASDASSFVTGDDMSVSGGMHK